jgi:O-antigen ligase
MLLMGLPFCLLVVRTRRGLSPFRFACMIGLVLVPLSILRTGSRGGLLALVILYGVYFFSVPALQKIPIAIGTLLVALASLAVTSHGALERYRTIFLNDDANYKNATEESAILSTRSRKELFFDSVRITFQHPLLGVGPGMFQVADAQNAEELKEPAAWHQTHNAYTQVSSEEGLPALIFYIAAIVYCFKTVRAGRKCAREHPELHEYADIAFALELSVLAFVITAIFAANAYYFFFPLVAGLCAALERSVKADMRVFQAATGAVRP